MSSLFFEFKKLYNGFLTVECCKKGCSNHTMLGLCNKCADQRVTDRNNHE